MKTEKRLVVGLVSLSFAAGITFISGGTANGQELRQLLLERMEAQQQMNPGPGAQGPALAQPQPGFPQNAAPFQAFARQNAIPRTAQPAQQGNTQYNIYQSNGTTGGAPAAGLAAMAAAALGAAAADSADAVPYVAPVPYGAGVYAPYGAEAARYGAYRGDEYAHAGAAAGATAAHYGAVQGEESAARGAAFGESAAHYGAAQGEEAAARGAAAGRAEGGFGAGGFGAHEFGGGRFGGFRGRGR